MLLDGTEGQQMMDNLCLDSRGNVIIQEDPGNQAHTAKIWQYTIATDTLKLIADHDASRFVTGGANFITQDEETSGIFDASQFLGPGWLIANVQAHTSNRRELVEFGQLVAIFNPASDTAPVARRLHQHPHLQRRAALRRGRPATSRSCRRGTSGLDADLQVHVAPLGHHDVPRADVRPAVGAAALLDRDGPAARCAGEVEAAVVGDGDADHLAAVTATGPVRRPIHVPVEAARPLAVRPHDVDVDRAAILEQDPGAIGFRRGACPPRRPGSRGSVPPRPAPPTRSPARRGSP